MLIQRPPQVPKNLQLQEANRTHILQHFLGTVRLRYKSWSTNSTKLLMKYLRYLVNLVRGLRLQPQVQLLRMGLGRFVLGRRRKGRKPHQNQHRNIYYLVPSKAEDLRHRRGAGRPPLRILRLHACVQGLAQTLQHLQATHMRLNR